MRATMLALALLAAPVAAGAQTSADPCATVPPDSRQRIDGKKSGSASTSGLPSSFADDGCDMLVADITVPAGYRVSIEGGVERGSIPTSSCEEWRLTTRWFRKSGGKYEPIGGKVSSGSPGSDVCTMERHVQDAEVRAQTTFRIAVSSLWGGPVRVWTSASVRPLSTATH
jgi:hypothetical protein